MNTAIIETVVREFFSSLGQTIESLSQDTVAGQTLFSLTVADGKALIGPRGETLRGVEQIIKKIAEKRGNTDDHYTIDINGYRKDQIKDIEMRAKMMAERAKSFQYDVELPPMSAYERLIVHATLSTIPNIKTESHGEGKNRRVVIKYSQ